MPTDVTTGRTATLLASRWRHQAWVCTRQVRPNRLGSSRGSGAPRRITCHDLSRLRDRSRDDRVQSPQPAARIGEGKGCHQALRIGQALGQAALIYQPVGSPTGFFVMEWIRTLHLCLRHCRQKRPAKDCCRRLGRRRQAGFVARRGVWIFLPPAARRGEGVSGQGQDCPQAQVK